MGGCSRGWTIFSLFLMDVALLSRPPLPGSSAAGRAKSPSQAQQWDREDGQQRLKSTSAAFFSRRATPRLSAGAMPSRLCFDVPGLMSSRDPETAAAQAEPSRALGLTAGPAFVLLSRFRFPLASAATCDKATVVADASCVERDSPATAQPPRPL